MTLHPITAAWARLFEALEEVDRNLADGTDQDCPG